MNRTDALVAAIGAGVLVVALAGAALTGSDASGGGVFAVTWPESTAEHDLGSAAIAGSNSAAFTYENPHANTTALHFAFTVTIPQPHVTTGADSAHVTVTSPSGETTEQDYPLSGAGGGTTEVTLDVNVGSRPTVAEARGATAAGAATSLAAQWTNTTGVGTWTFEIAINHAGLSQQDAHNVAGSVEVHWYTAEVAESPPTSR